MKNLERTLNAGYGAIFGTYWMIYAGVGSFASVYLLAHGYSNSKIGLTFAFANVLAVILQPLVADFCDRSRKLGVIGTTEIMTACMMVFTAGMFIFKGGAIALCVVFVLLIAFHTVLQPLFNSLAARLDTCGEMTNYGVARAVGSLAYSIFVAALGILVERSGVIMVPISCEIMCALLIISLIFTSSVFKKAKAINEANGKLEAMRKAAARKGDDLAAEPQTITLIDFIKRNKMFFVMNLSVLGIFFSNAVLNNYMAQIVDGVGGTTADMGKILAIMAALEIPGMVFFKPLMRKFSCQKLLKVASIGFTIKIAVCWLANSVFLLYVAMLFQLISFALFLPGMVYFTAEIMSEGEAVKGQALFTTMITITTIFSSLLGGWVLDIAGPKALTLIATIATAAGTVLIIAIIDKIKKK